MRKIVNAGKLLLQKLLAPFSTSDKMNIYLTSSEKARLEDYQEFWNFYNGYHWENVADDDRQEFTTNWCARFVNKYVATEFNSGFLFKFDTSVEEKVVPFLNNVWDDNNGSDLMARVGQEKSITGDAYVHVFFESPDEINDPFGMYPKGRIRLFSIPASLVFPKYKDGYNDSFDALESITIMYPINTEGILGNVHENIVRFVYTNETITKYVDREMEFSIENKYGIIPIVPFKNLALSGSNFGQSDLRDLIDLNLEYNLKTSDISQILEYCAAPTTIVQGAKPNNLTKGANKTWLVPKDAKVYNLELKGDLVASNSYLERLVNSIYNIGSMPKLAIGGDTAPSNLSGIALQISFMPLTDLITQKRVQSAKSIIQINKIALRIGVVENLISIPQNVDVFKFYNHNIWWGDILPKDMVTELEMIQSELKAGLTTREDAMVRLYKDNVTDLSKKVEEDAKKYPQFYGMNPLSMPAGNRLVNTFDGSIIVKQEDTSEKVSNGTQQVDLKNTVGRNRDGEDKQLNSGLQNFNPPKE